MNSPIHAKSRDFAIRIIHCYNYLVDEKHEKVMSKQLLRCGTSITANTRESKNAQSRMDFLNKLKIALKEADEAEWIFETRTCPLSPIKSNKANNYGYNVL